MKTLKQNYQANINILKENFKRGMSVKQANAVINSWREQFINANLYGDDEKAFINAALDVVSEYTHFKVVEM